MATTTIVRGGGCCEFQRSIASSIEKGKPWTGSHDAAHLILCGIIGKAHRTTFGRTNKIANNKIVKKSAEYVGYSLYKRTAANVIRKRNPTNAITYEPGAPTNLAALTGKQAATKNSKGAATMKNIRTPLACLNLRPHKIQQSRAAQAR